MTTLGTATADDINHQVDAWVSVNRMLRDRADEIRHAWNALDIDSVHFIGSGSVNYLSQTAAPLLQTATGISASSDPASAFLVRSGFPVANPERTLLVAISRSGETTELVEAVSSFQQRGGNTVWGITTRSNSSLAGRSDLVIAEDLGFEGSVVQTRSFSSLLAMMQGVVATISGDALPPDGQLAASGESCLASADLLSSDLEVLGTCERVIFLASRLGFGLALEGQLLMNEMALTDSVAHQFLDFRHGPISMVDEHTLVVGLLDAAVTDQEVALLNDVAGLGASVVTLSMGPDGPSGQPSLQVDPHGLRHLPLFMPAMQKMAHRRALARNLDPDNPRHLSAVVILDGLT